MSGLWPLGDEQFKGTWCPAFISTCSITPGFTADTSRDDTGLCSIDGFQWHCLLTHEGGTNSDEGQEVEMEFQRIWSVLVDRSSANNLLFTSCCPSPAMWNQPILKMWIRHLDISITAQIPQGNIPTCKGSPNVGVLFWIFNLLYGPKYESM